MYLNHDIACVIDRDGTSFDTLIIYDFRCNGGRLCSSFKTHFYRVSVVLGGLVILTLIQSDKY